jgi:hypothetical protein
MKFLVLFLISTSVFASRSPLLEVDGNIVAEERLKAANDFSVDMEADCASGKFTTEQCTSLRSFINNEKYNSELKRYSYHEKLADDRAMARHSENKCVKRLRSYFDEKSYAYKAGDTCAELESALLVLEPILRIDEV